MTLKNFRAWTETEREGIVVTMHILFQPVSTDFADDTIRMCIFYLPVDLICAKPAYHDVLQQDFYEYPHPSCNA